MTTDKGIMEIVTGISFLLIFLLSLVIELRPRDFIYLFIGLFIIISGIFNYTQNYNKNLFRAIIAAIIIVPMLIFDYRMLSLGEDSFVLIALGGTILIILLMYLLPREWEKAQIELEEHDEVIE